jgi:hypothetical protein
MSRYNGIRPVTNGLVFCIDPTNRQSYTSGSTIVYDLANTTTGATLFNGPTFSTGSTSNFITFDGTNDYFSSSYVHTQSDHTVIAIVKLSTLNDDWIPIIEFSTTGGTSPWRAHYYVQGLTNTFNAPYSYRGFGANFFNGSSIANDQWYSPVLYETNANEWMMLTGRVSGTTIGDTFVNKIKSRPTTACTYSNQSIISIGNVRTGSFYYGGNLGLVLYYNRALTDNEIIQTYNAYKNRFNLPGDIVTNGLVLNLDTAYYNSYPRTGTTWSDLSGSGNNGTLTNGPTYVVTGASSSIQFDGVDDYVDCGNNSSFNLTSQLTLECWVKTSDVDTYNHFISKFPASECSYLIGSIQSTGYLYFSRSTNGINQGINGQFDINVCDGNWKHIVVSYNSNTSTLLMSINGTIQTSSLSGNVYVSTSNLNVGRRTDVGQYYSANISNVKIYNRALSATEVSQNFNALRGRFGI